MQYINILLTRSSIIKKRTFKEEYIELLNKFVIEYDERYLFEFFDDIDESQIIRQK
jgi:hypothetical protein